MQLLETYQTPIAGASATECGGGGLVQGLQNFGWSVMHVSQFLKAGASTQACQFADFAS